MTRFVSRKMLYVIIGVCILPFVAEALLIGVIQKAVPGIWIEAEQFSSESHLTAPRFHEKSDSNQKRYAVTITGEEFRKAGGNDPALLVNRISGEGYRVYLNSTLIGSFGDYKGARANVRNAAMVYSIDNVLIHERNELVFYIRDECDTRFSCGILLTNINKAWVALSVIICSSDAWSYIGIGFLFSGFVGILLMILFNPHRHQPHILILIALMATAVYAADFIYMPYLPFSYIVFKKIIAGAMYISLASLSGAISLFFHKKLPVIVGIIPLAVITAAILLVEDAVAFSRVYAICSISVPVITAIWMGSIRPCIRVKEETWIFMVGLGLFCAESLYDVVMAVFNPSLTLGSIYPFAFLFLSVIILLMQLAIKRKNETIQQESSRRFHFYRKAITDGLTGLFNREYVLSHLANEKPPFAVAMLDIDHFKEINDHFGHQAGDKVIQYAAETITGALRGTDLVGRYGGDEFIVILRSSGANAFAVMERFRDEIAQSPLGTEEYPIPLTFSIGIGYVVEEETPDQMLRKADMALYMAKRNGRNRVCVYEEE